MGKGGAMIVYVDVVFITNLISSLLLFFSANLIFSIEGKWYRILISAIFCGIYAVTDAIYFLWKPIRGMTLFIMILISWGYRGCIYNSLRVAFLEGITVVLIVGISNLFGINSLVFESGITLIAKDLVTAIVTTMVYPIIIITNKVKSEYKRFSVVTVNIDGAEVKFKLLYDSGNLLRHKDLPVIIIDWRNIPCVHSYEEVLLTAPERLIYNTVSSSSIMPLIKPQKTVVEGIERECYIGLTNKRFVGYAGVIGNIK